MIVKLLTEYHLEFLSLRAGCIYAHPESTLVKKSKCWKSHAAARLCLAGPTVAQLCCL